MSTNGWNETLMTSTIDGATLTAAAAATAIPAAAKYTFAPNFFNKVGQKIRIIASGRISSVITTPGTARFDVRFGATVVFDSLAVLLDTAAGYTNVGWNLTIEMTLRTIGSSANFIGQGYWNSTNILGQPATAPKGGLQAVLPWNSAPALGNNFDATASQQCDFFFTQTVATGSLIVHQYELISCN